MPKVFERKLKEPSGYFYLTKLTTGEAKKKQRFIVENLLCADCEQLINQKYEDQSTTFMETIDQHLGPMANPSIGSSTVPPYDCGLHLSGIDYPSFKLFVLSVLWRMSITKYYDVSLGSKHEAKIKNMLLSCTPDDPMTYPILIGLIYDGPKRLFDTTAWSGRVNGHWNHCMMFGGAIFTVFVTSHKTGLPNDIKGGILHPDGTANVLKTDFRNEPKIAKWISDSQRHWQRRYGQP